MSLSIPIPAVRGQQGARMAVYQTTVRVADVLTILGHDPRSIKWRLLPDDIREAYEKLQRKTSKPRRESAQRYMRDRIGPMSYWIGAFPAIAIGVTDPQTFKPYNEDRPDVGDIMFVAAPQNRRILLDGLGRLSAAFDVWLDKTQPQELRDFAEAMSLPVTIFTGVDRPLTIDELGQLFHDFNVLGVPVGKGQAIDLDHSDIYINLVNQMCEFPVFTRNGGVDPRAAKLSVNSKALAVKAVLLKFARAAIEGPGSHVDHIREEIADPRLTPETMAATKAMIEEFLNGLAAAMGADFTKRNYLHLSNPGWVALGLICNDLYSTLAESLTDSTRATYVERLGKIDWSPTNPDFLEFLGAPNLDQEGMPVKDDTGRVPIGKFYGGSKAFYNLGTYLRHKLGLDKILPDGSEFSSSLNFAVLSALNATAEREAAGTAGA